MPNYCFNSLTIEGPAATLSKIRNLVNGEKNVFDFDRIIPMPDYVYRGNLGPKETEIYGKNNWYDWSCENWGTKWNSVEARLDDFSDCLEYCFDTAWSPCEPVIKALVKMFPETKVYYTYSEPGCCFFGKQEYENGQMTYEVYGDYSEHWYFDDEPEEKKEPGLFYSVNNEQNFGPATTYNFTYRDTDFERTILIDGFCCDARKERKPFDW